MSPDPVKNEEELTARLEDWVQKCERLAEYGSEYQLPAMYKTVALQRILKGEARRLYERGRLVDRMLTKLQEYARGMRLHDDTSKGMQGVNMNWTKAEEEENEGGNEGQDGDLFDSEDSDESDDGDGAEKETGKEDQSQHLVSGPWSFVSCLLSLIALPYTI